MLCKCGLTVFQSRRHSFDTSFENDSLLFFLFNFPQPILPDLSKLVVNVEFIRDDGYRKTCKNNTYNRTAGPDKKTPNRLRVLVAIAYGRHGNHGPPETDRDVSEMACREVVLCVVHDTGKDDHADCEDK